MKKILLLIVFTIGLIVCNSKQTSIDNLANLTEEIQNESAEYSQEDWEQAAQEYEMIEQELSEFKTEYTDEELKEIGRLKGICLARFAKHSLRSLGTEMENALKEAKGIMEGFTEELSNEQNRKY